MKNCKLEEIFKFAISIEEDGKRFYQGALSLGKNKKFQDLFLYLSKQEQKHARTFAKFYNFYAKKKITFQADKDLEQLLDVLTRGLLFPTLSEVRSTLKKSDPDNIVPVIRIAMDVELNTITFYQEIAGGVDQRQTQKALRKIIQEEKSHLIRLKNLRMDLDPLYSGISYGRFF